MEKGKLNIKRLIKLMAIIFWSSALLNILSNVLRSYFDARKHCECLGGGLGSRLTSFCSCDYDEIIGILEFIVKTCVVFIVISLGIIIFIKIIIPVFNKLKEYLYSSGEDKK